MFMHFLRRVNKLLFSIFGNISFLMKKIIFLSAFLFLANLHAQQLSPSEKQMVDFLRKHEQEQIDFLEKSVNINSGTMNPEGVREVGMLYKEELDNLGFETRWISMPDSLNRAGHLFAELKGDTGKTILLIGHLDSVFEKDHEFQTFSRDGDNGTGPAANDMKGGNAVIIYALKALHAAGELKKILLSRAMKKNLDTH